MGNVYYNMPVSEIIEMCIENKERVVGEVFSKCDRHYNKCSPELLHFSELTIGGREDGVGDATFVRFSDHSKVEDDFFVFPIDIFLDDTCLENYLKSEGASTQVCKDNTQNKCCASCRYVAHAFNGPICTLFDIAIENDPELDSCYDWEGGYE